MYYTVIKHDGHLRTPRKCRKHELQVSVSVQHFSSVLKCQFHHAVHNMSKKPLGLFWQFRPSTSNYNDTLYCNLMQDVSIRHKTSDRAERQFTQILLSDGGQKKPGGKNFVQEIWVGTMTQTLNSPSYEATNFKRVYPRWLKERYT